MKYRISMVIEKENGWYVAFCPELDVTSQGKSIEEARNNLKEAAELFLKHADPSEIHLPEEPPFLSALEIAV